MRGLFWLSVLAGMAALPSPGMAQRDPCAGRLDSVRLDECLQPGGAVRGIRPATAAPAAAVAPARAAPTRGAAPPAAASSVDLTVPFGFDSAELTSDGAAVLAALAAALKDPALAGAKFRIAGHTDGKGTDAYNDALSSRRAEAARRYLVEQGGVDPARLSTVGFGRRQLYDAANPMAASNRRVQVIRLEN